MEVVHPRCAGLDVSKRDVKVCVRVQGRGSRPTRATVTTWGSTTGQILALRDMLVAEGVDMVVMESTVGGHEKMPGGGHVSARWRS